MNHLHSEGIVHGDLKAGNVLLKAELRPMACDTAATTASAATGGCSCSSMLTSAGPRGAPLYSAGKEGVVVAGGGVQYQEQLVAKVADFGLACRLRDQDTHVSGVHRVSAGKGALSAGVFGRS